MDYKQKYLKYKQKYLLYKQRGGSLININIIRPSGELLVYYEISSDDDIMEMVQYIEENNEGKLFNVVSEDGEIIIQNNVITKGDMII